jgi:hypothetical protein
MQGCRRLTSWEHDLEQQRIPPMLGRPNSERLCQPTSKADGASQWVCYSQLSSSASTPRQPATAEHKLANATRSQRRNRNGPWGHVELGLHNMTQTEPSARGKVRRGRRPHNSKKNEKRRVAAQSILWKLRSQQRDHAEPSPKGQPLGGVMWPQHSRDWANDGHSRMTKHEESRMVEHNPKGANSLEIL